MTIATALKDFGHRMVNRVHRAILAVSGGRLGSTMGSMPVIELTTIGRTSGSPRTVMLTAPIHDDDRYVIVASKGGDSRHPAWYLNLVANPEVEVSVHGRTIPMTARTATPDERAELWPKITRSYRGYAGYQTKTTREIPVVICEPRPDSA
ncbi:nitroreductase family deazaflavin-dependent oxidoreductase [Microbacterium sp. NPDC076911]|uniref:nitroreductase family deazaflavin-dependent oxidoreductase n=1 Tax=Microbacterium sp. NPDC076911 TaxID=3154958 RepID=UPI0034293341